MTKYFDALALVLAGPSLAHAASGNDPVNQRPWDYNVHGSMSAMSRAALMLQAKQPRSLSSAGSSGSSSGILPGVGSIANMNVITVVVGEIGNAGVTTEADQSNTGRINATGVSAKGQSVDIGTIN